MSVSHGHGRTESSEPDTEETEMAQTVRRCSGCNGVLEDWQPDVCSDQCGQAVTDLPDDDCPDDDYDDCWHIGGAVDGFGLVHSDADPGL